MIVICIFIPDCLLNVVLIFSFAVSCSCPISPLNPLSLYFEFLLVEFIKTKKFLLVERKGANCFIWFELEKYLFLMYRSRSVLSILSTWELLCELENLKLKKQVIIIYLERIISTFVYAYLIHMGGYGIFDHLQWGFWQSVTF